MLTDAQKKVVERTIEKFQTATGLSFLWIDDEVGDIRRCLYSHEVNGVGCAIGCHTDNEELAKKWDEEKASIDTIKGMYSDEFEKMFPELDRTDTEDIEFLYDLQNAHDYANNMSEFLVSLGQWIEEGYKPD